MNSELTDYEKKVMLALCDTDVRFKVKVVLGFLENKELNCIFKIDDNKWGIELLGTEKVEIFDDIVFACYKIIMHSVSPEIVDFVLNYFNNAIKQERKISSFLEYANVKKKQMVKL